MNPVLNETINTINSKNKTSINNNNVNDNINVNNFTNDNDINNLYTEEELALLGNTKDSINNTNMSVCDEEDWQEVPTSSRKRKISSELHIESKFNKTSNYENRFALLRDGIEQSEEIKTEPKPPPIFLPGISNIVAMNNELKRLINNEYVLKGLKDNQVKLMVKTIPAYRKIIKHFDLKKKKYFTYQLKQERAYRVVLKNLHHSTPKADIKEELLSHGHDTRQITNVYSKTDKTPLPMFFVDLEPKANNKNIYEIRVIYNTIVKFEPPLKSHDLVQCHRCQEFGHTKNYCRKPYKCVKCGLNHASAECKKTHDTPPQCAHCKGSHTSNYKGCTVYQELKSRKNNLLHRTRNTIQPNANWSTGMSYADVLNSNNNNTSSNVRNNNCNCENSNNININENSVNNHHDNNSNSKLELLIQKQIEQMSVLMNMMSTLLNKLCQ